MEIKKNRNFKLKYSCESSIRQAVERSTFFKVKGLLRLQRV